MKNYLSRIIKKIEILINKKANLNRLKFNHVVYKSFQINGKIFVKNNGTMQIGSNFSANSGINQNPIGGDTLLRLIVEFKSARLTIGNNVGISNSTIACWDQITIGNNVVIGGGVKIWDTNFHSTNANIRLSGNDYDIKTAPIFIQDNVFIGAGTIILKGVTIGENSIIAAGSVVVKDIPSNVIAGGNPCTVVSK